MAQFPITKTTSHDQPVGTLYATQDGSSNYLFPTWLITSAGVEIGTAASPLYVSPGTGASWAVTGPLTDVQLRASAVPVSLASAPLPTDAATATKQDAQTTHLATLAGAVSGTEVQVDVVTMPTVNVAQSGSWSVAVSSSALPTGASTAANQATIIAALASIDGHVDGVEGALASIDAKITAVNTGAVVVASSALPTGAATAAKQDSQTTHLATLAGAVAGTEVQVDVVSLPTVTIQDGGGAITVDGSVAISGSVVVTNAGTFAVQAAQSGTWNITNISGTISLPTGAATAAKQPALGTAGSASADVLTVQGIASMTALKVDGSAVTQPVSIAAAVAVTDNNGSLTVDDGGTTLSIDDGAGSITVDGTVAVSGSVVVTNAGTFAVQAAQSGTWNITNISGTISLPTGAATAAKQPALGTAGTASSDVITVQGIASMVALKVDGSAVTQPVSGTFWQATQPVSIAAAVAVTDNSGSLTVDDGGSSLTVDGTVAATQSGTWTVTGTGGTFPITDSGGSITVDGTISAAQSGAWSVSISGTPSVAQSGTWTVGLSAGTNNIGDVDVLTQPARAATTDTITAKLATDAIQNGTTALTPKFAKISASSSGNNTVVAAVTSKKIRVLGWNLVGNGAVNAKWQDGAGGTDLTGLYYVAAAGGGICVPFNPVGWFETSSNTLLNLNLSGAVAVGGSLCYVEV